MSGDINVQTFSGKVNINNNLKVGSGHLFVDTLNNQVGLNTNDPQANLHVNGNTYVHTNFRVGPSIVMNETTGQITAGSFVGDGSALQGINSDSGSWVNGTSSNVHLATNGDSVGIGTTTVDSGIKLQVNGVVKATGFTGIQESDVPTLSAYATTSALSTGLATKAALAGSTTQNFSAERVGMGATASASYKLYVKHDDTTATGGTTAAFIDANYSGSDTFTGDMTNRGLFIDVDSSATGGGTSHEHRLYGVYADVRHTGDSDLCYAGYFYAKSDHTAGQCSALKGIYASAQDSANGTNSAVYAGEFKALKDSGSTNTTATMMGIRAEVEIDAGIITNAYGVHSHIDRDGGTITNGYLFHGSYNGSDTGVKWGIYLSGAEKNYLTGTLEVVGTVTAPTFSGGDLDVSGSISGNTGVFTGDGNVLLVGTGGKLGLTINDGEGNANLTFNHASRIPDQNGSAGRIDCGVDGNAGYMRLRVKDSVTAGTAVSLSDCFRIEEEFVRAYDDLYVDGNMGVGTTTPAQKLDVNGNIKLDGSGRQIYLDTGGAGLYWGSGYSRIVDDGDLRICTDDNLHFNTGCNSSSLGTERMVLLANGTFSIGNTSPPGLGQKLHVEGHIRSEGQISLAGYVNRDMTARYYNSSGGNATTTASRPLSVYAQHHIRCSELQVESDRRIKTYISDVDDSSALTLLRKIKPRTYGYVDKVHNGEGHVYGFIAQEIKELIPDAVDVSEGDLPNIYKHATIDIQANSITIKDFDTSTLNQTDSIIYIDQDDQRKTLKIKSIINSTQLEIEEDLEKLVETLKTSKMEEHNFTGEIFIWGQKVQDFHHLKKSAIYTVATAALQEVDRQLQAEKEKTQQLEVRLSLLESTLASLIS